MALLTESELRALPTHRLLAYQARIRRVPEGPSFWHPDSTGGRVFHKGTPEYTTHRRLLRSILDEREHVARRRSA